MTLLDPQRRLSVVLVLAALCAAIPLPAQDQAETTPEGCVVEKFKVNSPSMGRDIEVAALVPPGYAGGGGKLPVLYALHGKDAPYLSFTQMNVLRKFLVDHPMLVVVFDADKDSCYIDSRHRPKSLFTTFYFKELVPAINKRYRTDGRMAVTGFSMGGYGAFHYLLEQPGLFSSVSAMSGAFELFDVKREKADQWRPWLEGLMGPLEQNRPAYEAVLLAPRIEKTVASGTKLPPLLMLCGTDDYLFSSNRRFIDFLQSVNVRELAKRAPELEAITDAKERRTRKAAIQKSSLIDFEYRETPGAHDWPYWSQAIAAVAEFHWRHFGPLKN